MHFIQSKTILSAKNGMNIYRGCTHGCIYCDSRSDCYQMDHLFEDIAVKQNAPELLEDALRRKRKPCMIGTGSMCDPYMHCEESLGYTRRCLEIIDKYGCGVTVITKSDMILRDIDLFERINRHSKAVAQITLTTYDEDLCRIIEPNVCTTRRRYEILKELQRLGNRTDTKEMKELLGYMARHRQALMSVMTDEQKVIFQKLDDCWSEYASLAEEELFTYAFRLGARIMLDAVSEEGVR